MRGTDSCRRAATGAMMHYERSIASILEGKIWTTCRVNLGKGMAPLQQRRTANTQASGEIVGYAGQICRWIPADSSSKYVLVASRTRSMRNTKKPRQAKSHSAGFSSLNCTLVTWLCDIMLEP